MKFLCSNGIINIFLKTFTEKDPRALRIPEGAQNPSNPLVCPQFRNYDTGTAGAKLLGNTGLITRALQKCPHFI
jgi:hypothetical protein